MVSIGIIGAGEVGSQIARAASANGYHVVLANSRGPDSLAELIAELGPSTRAAFAAEAAAAVPASQHGARTSTRHGPS